MQRLTFRRLQNNSPVIYAFLIAGPASALVWGLLWLLIQVILFP